MQNNLLKTNNHEPVSSHKTQVSQALLSTENIIVKAAYVITMIDGVKQYVRRKSINAKGRARVTMHTTNIGKALNFGSVKNAADFKDRIGNGYDVEIEK